MSSFLKKMAEKYFHPIELKADKIKLLTYEGTSGRVPFHYTMQLEINYQEVDALVQIWVGGSVIRNLEFHTSGQTEHEVADNLARLVMQIKT